MVSEKLAEDIFHIRYFRLIYTSLHCMNPNKQTSFCAQIISLLHNILHPNIAMRIRSCICVYVCMCICVREREKLMQKFCLFAIKICSPYKFLSSLHIDKRWFDEIIPPFKYYVIKKNCLNRWILEGLEIIGTSKQTRKCKTRNSLKVAGLHNMSHLEEFPISLTYCRLAHRKHE